MSPPLVIHIGYHKSGTTFLQREVFNRRELGFLLPSGPEMLAATEEFVNVEPVAFDPENARKRFQPLLEEAARDQLTPVISDERLSSIPESGRYHLPFVMNWLVETFGDFKVLLTIREQRSMAVALYRQAVRSGSPYGLQHFLGTGQEPDGWTSFWQPTFFEYSRVYDHLVATLGSPDRVCVLPLELLRVDRNEYLQRLFAFCDVPGGTVPDRRHNYGLRSATTEWLRLTNRLVIRNRLGPSQPWEVQVQAAVAGRMDTTIPKSIDDFVRRRWSRALDRRIGESYSESNAKLSEAIGLDLAKLGYPCATFSR